MTFLRKIKKPLITVLAVIVCFVIYFVAHLGYNYFSGNIHTVISGKVYRTAQLDREQLIDVTKRFGLKSIINLRGVWPDNDWYKVESKFAKNHDLNYYSIRLSAYNLPKKQQLRKLVHILQTAPKPFVFHCEGGADRTGMASVLSLILYKPNGTEAQLKRQASWHYNAISSKTVGYQLLRNYFAWLKANNYKLSKSRFMQWLASPDNMKAYEGHFWV